MPKLKPQFFCDNCNYEVDDNVKSCPHCGRLFVSVRCPICDYSGPDRMFQSGCPMCGYSEPPSARIPKAPKEKPYKEKSAHAEPLPFWTYIATAIALLTVIAFLSHLITK